MKFVFIISFLVYVAWFALFCMHSGITITLQFAGSGEFYVVYLFCFDNFF